MKTFYQDFTNKYQVSKTLRFELIPQNETLEFLEKNNTLEDDEKRAEKYIILKKLMDEYYKAYIEETLNCVVLDGIEEYAELYYKNQKTEEERDKLKNIETNLRKMIVAALEKGKSYNNLFKKELIEKDLPVFLEGRSEDIELVKSFKGFATLCVGYWENRKNMFSDEEKSTAISYRIINENFPKFLNNMRIYKTQIKGRIQVSNTLLERVGVENLDDIFSLEFFSRTLSQSGIVKYNGILGGFSEENKEKIQGINELINLHNQKKENKKIGKLQPLFKQILSDTSSFSFIAEPFENDEEVIQAVNTLYNEFSEHIIGESETISALIANLSIFNHEGIFIKNDQTLNDFSNKVFLDWSYLKNHIYDWYDQEGVGDKERSKRYYEQRDKYLKNFESFPLDFIEKCIDENLNDKFKNIVNSLQYDVLNAYEDVKFILKKQYSYDRDLINDNEAVKKIKNLLDTMKNIESYLKLFIGTGKETERDEVFYGEINNHIYVLDVLDNIYNKVRNYVTRKPYKTEKVKLVFSRSDFLNTWEQEYRTKSGILFEKEGLYYLGIVTKKLSSNEVEYLSEGNKNAYRLLIDVQKPDMKNTPRLFIRSKGTSFSPAVEKYKLPIDDIIDIYDAKKFKTEYKKKNPIEFKEALIKMIDYFKLGFMSHENYKDFDFKWRRTEEYNSIDEFYRDTMASCYRVKRIPICYEKLEEYVAEGKISLFKIYNKDFSEYSKGKPNLHTLYWRAVFDDLNMKNICYKLNGQAEIFYRKKSISEKNKIIHEANCQIENKNPNSEKRYSLFDYDIVKDRRYTLDKFQFHVPITMNFTADGNGKINADIREAICNSDNLHIIGIDRGERHLLYVSVIDLQGNIVEQYSLNKIINEYCGNVHETNYHFLLDKKESERLEARKEWKTIENIKELKDGYLSQVVHIISKLMIKYNAIVVMEDLNFGFKRGRQKIEKQVYQKFEKALIDKLNYLVDKSAPEEEITGIYKALQLTEKFVSFNKMGKQNGAIFYVPAWNTSKMDPTTGFVNLLYLKYESIEKTKKFIEKIKDIRLINDENGTYYGFDIDYNDFTEKAEGTKSEWTICSYGKRIFKEMKNGYWKDSEIDLTKAFTEYFESNGININENIKEQLLEQNSSEFFKKFMWLLKLTLQIRNSRTNSEIDYMLSPVKNSSGKFFCTDDPDNKNLPTNSDANGAYNIARKGIWVVEQLKSVPKEKVMDVKLAVSNKEWMNFAQKFSDND